jgi:hypothetical protein
MSKKLELVEAEKLYDKFLKIADTGNISFDDLETIAKNSAIEAIELMLYQSHVFGMKSRDTKASFVQYWEEVKYNIKHYKTNE